MISHATRGSQHLLPINKFVISSIYAQFRGSQHLLPINKFVIYFLSFFVTAFLSAGIGGLVVVTLPTKGSISTVSSAFFLNRTPIGSPVSPRRALAITLFLNFNFLRLISARTTNIIMARISNVPITADQ